MNSTFMSLAVYFLDYEENFFAEVKSWLPISTTGISP